MRNALAVLAGMVVGGVFNMAVVTGNSALYTPPQGADLSDPAQFAAYIGTLPAAAFLIVMTAHLGQAFLGGGVAARLATSHATAMAMIVGGLTMLACVANLVVLPAPAWMWIEVPLSLVVAWGAAKLVERVRPAA